ncbi:MAG: putative nitrogenase-associated protein [Comamonadaceae bacterium]|nr:MAG: putative nitrogenase-associated protein [Comamonadaceae bacterium]
MTHLVFFEKPGCGGNARQRAALMAAGHTLEQRNLLTEPWTAQSLLAFLAPLPVADWFNRAAPRVKSGEVLPDALEPDAALALLLAEPLLIRRPLMQRSDNGTHHVGFETAAVDAWVGLGTNPARNSASFRTLEGCASPTEHCAAPV